MCLVVMLWRRRLCSLSIERWIICCSCRSGYQASVFCNLASPIAVSYIWPDRNWFGLSDIRGKLTLLTTMRRHQGAWVDRKSALLGPLLLFVIQRYLYRLNWWTIGNCITWNSPFGLACVIKYTLYMLVAPFILFIRCGAALIVNDCRRKQILARRILT